MQIKENIQLAPYTTFKIGGPARFFCEVKDQQEALEAFEFAAEKKLPVFVMGGGSNVLISDSGFNGLVVRVVNKDIEIVSEDENTVLLKVASGEVWDEVVDFAVKNGWWGIENLSHIPGSTGAIAVQNVGAYGQEAKNVIEAVTVFNTQTHQILNLENRECGFAYRRSIFNTSEKGKYIIFYINFRLQKNGKPNLSYRDIQAKFAGQNPGLLEMRKAVTEIRDTKFPFPTEAKKGNAGSFFKNPVLDMEQYGKLESSIVANFGKDAREKLRSRVFTDDFGFKIPAAFLIDICGLKDLENGGAVINHSQPLVIVNKTGQASAEDVRGLAMKVRSKVMEKTGVELKFEPELVGF